MKRNPKVSICIPTYNSEKFLPETINSILNQTYENIEIFVVDNKSSDNTVEIAMKLLSQYPNAEVIVNEVNLGGEGNANKCIQIARGDLIAIYHSDDVYHKDIVKDSVELFLSKGVAAVSAMGIRIDDTSNSLNKDFQLPKELLSLNKKAYGFDELYQCVLTYGNTFLICPSVMISRKTINAIGSFDFPTFRSSSDVGLWLKAASYSKFGIVNKKRISYRVHEGQGTNIVIKKNLQIPDSVKIAKFFTTERYSDLEKVYINRNLLYCVYRRLLNNRHSHCKKMLNIILNNILTLSGLNHIRINTSLLRNVFIFSVLYMLVNIMNSREVVSKLLVFVEKRR